MSTDFRRHGDDWLSDIFNHSEGGRISVCAICKQKEAINQDSIFSVCKKCERPERTPRAGLTDTGLRGYNYED
jgi:hypothetical protein